MTPSLLPPRPLAISRPTKLKLAAYLALLVTLFLPFSRCSHTSSAPTGPTGLTAPPPPENPPEPAPLPPAEPPVTLPPQSPPPSPWYHLFARNSPEAEYKYGMDLMIDSWALPTTLPKELDATMLVPGRMYYIWPLATLALALWWPPVRWRRSFHAIEIVLALGGMYWALVATVMSDPRVGFWVAEAALAAYALTALGEWIAEWRRLRRARYGAASRAT